MILAQFDKIPLGFRGFYGILWRKIFSQKFLPAQKN